MGRWVWMKDVVGVNRVRLIKDVVGVDRIE